MVVTGANSGIGKAVTRELADRGATVVMACRSLERGEAAAAAIEAEGVTGDLEVRACDLADLDSVATVAESLRRDFDDLRLLLNNAGVMAIPYGETADGFERQFGINHLGHFALTGQLLDLLRAAPGESRVVTQSSRMHERAAGLELIPGVDPGAYDRWQVYAESKLANVLFARELDRRLEAADAAVVSVSCEPGFVDTDLFRGPRQDGSRLLALAMRLATAVAAQSPARGAASMVMAATDADIGRRDHVRPGGWFAMRGTPIVATPSQPAMDADLASQLWADSVEATDVGYTGL